jgi:hypothetical protein
MEEFHSGKLTLPALQKECQSFQEITPAKLTDLQGAEVEEPVNGETKFNRGQYTKIGSFDPVPVLKFVEVTDETEVPKMISDATQEGFSLIFNKTLFISGEEQRVLGFGKIEE